MKLAVPAALGDTDRLFGGPPYGMARPLPLVELLQLGGRLIGRKGKEAFDEHRCPWNRSG